MQWYVFAFISVFANSGMFFCFRRLQRNYPIEVYLFYAWIISGIFIGAVSLPSQHIDLNGMTLLLLAGAGVASWIGNYAYNVSLKQQPNLGYVEALSSTRIAIAYVVSLLYFGSHSTIPHFLALLGVVCGLVLVAYSKRPTKSRTSLAWIVWALLSGVMFAVLAILTKLTLAMGLSAPAATAIFLMVAALLYGLTAIANGGSFRLREDWRILALAGLLAGVANFTLFLSYGAAPNLAYPVAISSSRMMVLYIFSQESARITAWDIRHGLGVLITFVSLVVLTLSV